MRLEPFLPGCKTHFLCPSLPPVCQHVLPQTEGNLRSFRKETHRKKKQYWEPCLFPCRLSSFGEVAGLPGPTCTREDVMEEVWHWVSDYLDPESSPWPPWLCD